ncbi:MAG TPA: UDP-N-acetylglucosamine--N-acetylmuramyl-(pentapeptide) pyrophosphoryl-undecaprenol N-acetylglucosamine transferase [bacterium]|nr:UDP-N-acetylglucosamine--N-acetylmuramyl-(pentapeptide) pyrophosphoryl-undecaprenol N-acetylglucosamine transferase [bacterium]
MTIPEKRKVAVVTGPTGGHFFPGLAIGEQFCKNGKTDVCFFVPSRDYIRSWLEKKGFRYFIIPPCRISLKDFLSPLRFCYAFFKAFAQISSGKFDVVFITGSYATVPYLLAARLKGIKTVVHEQNCRMGKVTSLSRYIADRIAITFPCFKGYPKRKTVVTGFPLISDFTCQLPRKQVAEEFGFSHERLTVLVFGGSQGSDFLNRLICDNARYLSSLDLQFIHLTGSCREDLQYIYDSNGLHGKVFRFYYDMSRLYSMADMVICRGGAGTLAEINAWKIPAIIVPYPYAGAHQKYNAMFFSERGCCRVISQTEENLRNFGRIFSDFIGEKDFMKGRFEDVSIVDKENRTFHLISELM